MIGRVVVRYDWQFSRFYVQEMSKMIIFIVPVPFSKILHNIRRDIYSCKNHLQLLCSLPHFGKGCLCTDSLGVHNKNLR